MENNLAHWHLCEELSVIDAALLIAGLDPAIIGYNIDYEFERENPSYTSAKRAITNAVLSKRLKATIRYDGYNGSVIGMSDDYISTPEIDLLQTTILVDDLKEWLLTRNSKSSFFFPQEKNAPDYLNRQSPYYAPKLAAAVEAWQAIALNPASRKSKSVKNALMKWIRDNAERFGLTNNDGKINELGIEEIAKIANWDPKGGAPKT